MELLAALLSISSPRIWCGLQGTGLGPDPQVPIDGMSQGAGLHGVVSACTER